MLRFFSPTAVLLLVSIALLVGSAHAALIPRYDLQSVCYMSTDIVEATLVRCHQPGKPAWSDTYTAAVLNSIEGTYKAGDQIKRLDMEQYSPDQISQHCILFVAPAGRFSSGSPVKNAPPQVVDMMLIDHKGSVHRYYQQSDPGLLVADYRPHQKHIAFAEERTAIMAAWVSAKNLQAPPRGLPYQILR